MAEQPQGNCPKCGMPVAQGESPTERDGVMYCCSGCASGGQCTCPGHAHSS